MRRNLQIEALEHKTLLAADVLASLDSGELIIIGTDNPDSVTVTREKGAIVVRANEQPAMRFSTKGLALVSFKGGDGDDTFVNHTSIDSLAYGNRGNDTLVGGTGSDELHGGPGHDTLFGNEGDDELHGDYGDDVLHGGRGDDDLRGWYGDDTLFGDEGDDILSGYEGDDVLFGGSGNDILKGHEGNDDLFGEDGNDELYGWTGDDLLVGADGNDYLSGWSGQDILLGGRGDDTLRGHAGRDLLIAGHGKDSLDGGSGEDVVVGGTTDYDDNYPALEAIMAAWDTNEDVDTRVNRLLNGLDGTPALNLHTVYSDSLTDTITDDRSELDLFIYDFKDEFVDA